jgi:TorA maturation chaperone TorD
VRGRTLAAPERVIRVKNTRIPSRAAMAALCRNNAMSETSPQAGPDEVDLARAREYSLLSILLLQSPSALLLTRLANLRGDTNMLGSAHAGLAQAAVRLDAEQVSREYFNLFTGVGRGELLPYASFYITGSLHARPLARLRETLREIGMERADWLKEPEDHAGVLFEIMTALCTGEMAAPRGTDREIFKNYLAPWIERFFEDLERAKSADFYTRVGTLGRVFMRIEAEAFTILT